MRRQYPIWNSITACVYKNDKSYGAKDTSENNIFVGTSAKYSYEHCKVITTKREVFNEKLNRNVLIFRTSLDGVVLKETIVDPKEKTLISQRTKLKRIKSL